MDRLERMDRRVRYSAGGAVAFVGVLLLVVGWYLISGEAVAAKQLPYLASASLPGAVLVVCGFVFAVSGPTERDAEAARRIAELHALLTEAVAAPGAGEPHEAAETAETAGGPGATGSPATSGPAASGPAASGPAASGPAASGPAASTDS
jgi:hypothetical protein